jgi:hypothetical protein
MVNAAFALIFMNFVFFVVKNFYTLYLERSEAVARRRESTRISALKKIPDVMIS